MSFPKKPSSEEVRFFSEQICAPFDVLFHEDFLAEITRRDHFLVYIFEHVKMTK